MLNELHEGLCYRKLEIMQISRMEKIPFYRN